MTSSPLPSPPSVADLAVRLARLEKTVDELEAAVTTSAADAPPIPTDAATNPAELRYPDLRTWVEEFYVVAFARPTGAEYRWCPMWWDHVEAILRLESLWRAWEYLRLDGQTGMAVWLRDHLDHQLPRLMAPAGPFARCSADRASRPHEPDQMLTAIHPPAGWPHYS